MLMFCTETFLKKLETDDVCTEHSNFHCIIKWVNMFTKVVRKQGDQVSQTCELIFKSAKGKHIQKDTKRTRT